MKIIALIWLTFLFGTVVFAAQIVPPSPITTMTPNWTYTGQVTPTPTPTWVPSGSPTIIILHKPNWTINPHTPTPTVTSTPTTKPTPTAKPTMFPDETKRK